jgi:TonB family protein
MAFKSISALLLLLVFAIASFGMSESAVTRLGSMSALDKQENDVWASTFRDARFSSITNTEPRTTCENTAAPEPLATPAPLLANGKDGARIVISFIIGTDGQVHSPLILRSSDDARDSTVLSAVRSWKFRPATCNGVPAESDGTVEFSRR